jgi:hypothetical protein
MDVFIISSFVSTFSPLVPLFLFWRTKSNHDPSMIYLAGLLLVSFLADMVGMVNSLYFKVGYVNETASYLYYLFAIVLVCLFYQARFKQKYKNLFIFSVIVSLSVYVYWVFTSPMIVTRHESKMPTGILFMALALSDFYFLMKNMPSVYIHRVTMFWVNSALVIYSSGTIILFIISNFLVFVLEKDQLEYWIFHNLLNTVSSILIAVGFFKMQSDQRSYK